MPGAVDTHVHLNHRRLLPKVEDVIARAHAAGVSEMIVVGYDLPSSETALRLAAEHSGLGATVGIHPHDAKQADDAALARLRELAAHPRVVGIGETGLDFYRDLSPREVQMRAFSRHLELASELGRPVICHCREAEEALLEVLAEWPHVTRVWHCFEGTAEQAARAVAMGVWISFGGTITYPDSDWRREFVAETPLERVLLETDAPYLAPYPKSGKRARDNEPAYLPLIAEAVAEIKGGTSESVMAVTAENARRVLGRRVGDRRPDAEQAPGRVRGEEPNVETLP